MFAQSTDLLPWSTSVIQLATATGFAGLVWYLVVKHIPSIESRHKEERDEWLSYIRSRDESFQALATQFVKEVTRIETRLNDIDANVKGSRNDRQ